MDVAQKSIEVILVFIEAPNAPASSINSGGCSFGVKGCVRTKKRAQGDQTLGFAASISVCVLSICSIRFSLIVPFSFLSPAGVLFSFWRPLAQILCPIYNPTIWNCSNNCQWTSHDERHGALRQPRMEGSDVNSRGIHTRCARRWPGTVGTQSRCTSSKYGGRRWRHTTTMERLQCRALRSWPQWAKRTPLPDRKEQNTDDESYECSYKADPNEAHDGTSNAKCPLTQRTQRFGICKSLSVDWFRVTA